MGAQSARTRRRLRDFPEVITGSIKSDLTFEEAGKLRRSRGVGAFLESLCHKLQDTCGWYDWFGDQLRNSALIVGP